MPNIELTENLRSTIRDLRKSKKKRGDELSKELGKEHLIFHKLKMER